MRGNEADAVFNRCSRKLYSIAMGVTGNRPMAEDAVHQALVGFLATQPDPDNLEAYLCRCVRNEALRAVTGQRRFIPDDSEFLTDTMESEWSKPEDEAFLRQVCDALTALSDDQRETIVMHIFGGLTFKEISDVREAPLGTVTSWYRRGIASLKTGVLNDE
ncbi:MAG: sigma-70 family RNA polymerase sigma factor [Xanthomonadales bacterium]|nr:sigma-70 family RNA polymerase sigma factor [Xanthomonadales bacterium]